MWLKLLAIVPLVIKLIANFTDPAKKRTNYALKLQKQIDKLERKRDELKRMLDKILASGPHEHRNFKLTDAHDELLNIQAKLTKLKSKLDNLLRDSSGDSS